MTSMEEWQLDAIDAVMRRCEDLSDFSSEQFAEVLEKMGFTISRRALPPTTSRARRNCSKITPHAAHNFSDYALLLRCPGVAGKPKTQKRGPSPSLVIVDEVPAAFFQRCNEFATHLPHGVCPGKESTEERDTQIPSDEEPACTITKPHERHVWEENDQVYGCPGVTGDEVRNLSEAFEKTPVDSNWIHRIPTVESSNECRVTGVFFQNRPEGKVFFVQYTDTWDRKHEAPLNDFLRGWERM